MKKYFLQIIKIIGISIKDKEIRIPSISPNQNSDADTQENREEVEKNKGDRAYEEIRQLRLHNDRLDEHLQSLYAERSSREKYGGFIFCGVLIYVVVALGILAFNDCWFHISDKVLIVLIGSTSVNVIGLLTIVPRSAFSNHHHKIVDGNLEKT